MDISTIGVFFILLALLSGIAYGYLLGRKDASDARDLIDELYAITAKTDLYLDDPAEDDLYLLGFCDGVAAQKALQQRQFLR